MVSESSGEHLLLVGFQPQAFHELSSDCRGCHARRVSQIRSSRAAIRAVQCSLMFLVFWYDFIEMCVDRILLHCSDRRCNVRLNISKLHVDCVFCLYVGEAAMMKNTLWLLLFKDFFDSIDILLTSSF